MINEQKIRVFLSLANTLSFTETATKLFITQQAVSKHIAQFEEDVGFRLFLRSSRRVALTPAGERAKHYFEGVIKSISEFLESERESQRKLDKGLRIGYNNWLDFGKAIVSARIRFHELYPAIAHVPERLPPDQLMKKLRTGELDFILVLRRFLLDESNLRIVELAPFPITILINRGVAENCPNLSLERLSQMPLLINSFVGETQRETIARAKKEMAQLGLRNERIVITPNRDSVYTAVETGEGIAVACAFSQLSSEIAMLPTEQWDTLVCVSLDSTKRKLIQRYAEILREEFAVNAP